MLHTEDNINFPEEHLQLLLKLFSILKIRVWYYKTIKDGDGIEAVGIMCNHYGKVLVYH